MSDWPPVWILFITFRRTEYAVRTIESLKAHLQYSNLHFHICDDGSKVTDDGTDRCHMGVCSRTWDATGKSVTYHEMPTPWGEFDMGGNTNRGIQIAQENGAHLYFLVHDDTILLDDLSLEPYVCIAEESPDVGMFRFNYLAPGLSGTVSWHKASRLGQELVFLRVIRQWSLFNPWHRETYLPAFQPALVHQRFYDAYGYYPEHYHPGLTECGMCAYYNQSPLDEEGPQVLVPLPKWPMDVKWNHIQKRAHAYKELTGSDV